MNLYTQQDSHFSALVDGNTGLRLSARDPEAPIIDADRSGWRKLMDQQRLEIVTT
ncbi:hypothetical protein [Mesorhizobium sp. ArgA1]